MINGFPEETKPLTDYEQNELLPIIVRGLSIAVGEGKAVTSMHICKRLKEKRYKIDPPRLRKVINHIRTQGIIKGLIATSKGYYIADDRSQIILYAESLQQRIKAINQVREALLSNI